MTLGDMTLGDATNKRITARDTVFKGAQIIFRDSVTDCVVLNISTTGARVRTATVVPVPEQVTLRLRGGTIIPALRRWTKGMDIGLEFAGAMSLVEEGAMRARAILEILRVNSLHIAIEHLRAERFFDDPELEAAAEDAEGAHARLEAVLKARVGDAS